MITLNGIYEVRDESALDLLAQRVDCAERSAARWKAIAKRYRAINRDANITFSNVIREVQTLERARNVAWLRAYAANGALGAWEIERAANELEAEGK